MNFQNLRPIPAASNTRSNMECRIGSWNAYSISNKSASIQERIASENLDIFCVVETSHESSFSPSLIASSPLGYKFLEKARPMPPQAPSLRGPLGGGVCVIYREHFNASAKDTGSYTTFEHLTCYFNVKDTQIILVVIYRPGSKQICNKFFSEFYNGIVTAFVAHPWCCG